LFTSLRSLVSALFYRSHIEQDMDEELRSHIRSRVEDLERSGLRRAEAERRASLEFGGYQKFKEECREALGTYFLEALVQDVRYGVRTLRKSPGFTAIAVLTLALGIGANTAIFSYVNAWLIHPLPYAHPEELVVALSHNAKEGWTDQTFTNADFLEYQKQASSFTQLAAWTSWFFNLTGDGTPDRVTGGLVSWNFFDALGARPMLGRSFLPQDSRPGSSNVAILSQGLWETRFGGDPRIIGRKITLQGETYTVIGVMRSDFQFPLMGAYGGGAANIWTPLAFNDKQSADRTTSWLPVLGRLKTGVTREQASAEMATIASRLAKLYPQTNTNLTTVLSSMAYEVGKEEGSQELMICFWAVGLVLLIASANVANLMLARGTGRAREFAVRGALGASRVRLVRQLLTESLLLFVAGGAAGTLLAFCAVQGIEASIPARIRGYMVNYGRVSLDITTLAYVATIAMICGIAFGLAPAFEASRIDVNSALKAASGRSTSAGQSARLRRVFVIGEIALASVLVISTGLLVKSFVRMVHGYLGFEPRGLVAAQVLIPPLRYGSDAQVRNFYEQVVQRVGASPGVWSASVSEYIPFAESSQAVIVHAAGQPAMRPGEERTADYTAVGPAYFSTMQIPLLRGRAFGAEDGPASPKVVVINEALMREFFANKNPIGRRLEIGHEATPCTVVGVVHDVKQFYLTDEPYAQVYVSAAQFPSASMSLVVRAGASQAGIATAIRRAVWSVDSQQPVSIVETMATMIAERNTPNRFLIQLMTFFGAAALMLGAIGIYGLMAHMVTQRTHEIGIRMAFGAQPRGVMRLVLGQGLNLTAWGLTIGLGASFLATRWMASRLYGVSVRDPLTFAGVSLLLAVVALAACYIPARRAMRLDPIIALRHE
jgi:predicted permease